MPLGEGATPLYTLLLEIYGVFDRRPTVDADSPNLNSKVAEFRRSERARKCAEFYKPNAEDERAAESGQGVQTERLRDGTPNSLTWHVRFGEVFGGDHSNSLWCRSCSHRGTAATFSRSSKSARTATGVYVFPAGRTCSFSSTLGSVSSRLPETECGMRAEGYGLTTHAVLSTPLAALACRCMRSFEGKSG